MIAHDMDCEKSDASSSTTRSTRSLHATVTECDGVFDVCARIIEGAAEVL
jgi:hypothetical protein